MSVASTANATAKAKPICLTSTTLVIMKAPKTTIMIATAAVMTSAVCTRPAVTAARLSRVRVHSSFMREMRKTS
nr:hypothetical protein [Actinomadura bangladeshensis]